MDSSFAYSRSQQPIPRPPKPRDLNIAAASTSGGSAGAGNGVRESSALRASVLDVALELGIGSSSLVTNWMFDNALTEEVEEDESGLVPPPSIPAAGSSPIRSSSTSDVPSTAFSQLRNPNPTSQLEGPSKYFPSTNSITSTVSSAALNYNPKLVPFQQPGLQISPTGGISFLDKAGPPPGRAKLKKKKSKIDAGYDSGVDGAGYMSEGGNAFSRRKTKAKKEKENDKEKPAGVFFPRVGDSIDGGPAGGSVNTAVTSASGPSMGGYLTDKEEKELKKARAKEEKKEKEEERKRKKSAAKAAKKAAAEAGETVGKGEGYETDAGYQSAAASTHSTPKKSRGIFAKLTSKSSRTDLKANSDEPPVPALPAGVANKKEEPSGPLPIALKFATTLGANEANPSGPASMTGSVTRPLSVDSSAAATEGTHSGVTTATTTSSTTTASSASADPPTLLDLSFPSLKPVSTTVANSLFIPSTPPPQLNALPQPGGSLMGDASFNNFKLSSIPTMPGPVPERESLQERDSVVEGNDRPQPAPTPTPTPPAAPTATVPVVPTSPPLSASSPASVSAPPLSPGPLPPPSASSQLSHLSASTQSRDSRSSADSGFSSGAASSSHTNPSSFNSKNGYPMYPKRGFTQGLGALQGANVGVNGASPLSPAAAATAAVREQQRPAMNGAAGAPATPPTAANTRSGSPPSSATPVLPVQPALKPPSISLPVTRATSPVPIHRRQDTETEAEPEATSPAPLVLSPVLRSATHPVPTSSLSSSTSAAPPSSFAMPAPPPVAPSGGGLKKSLKSKLSLDNLPLLGNRNRDKDRLGVRDRDHLGGTPSPILPNSPYVMVQSANSSADNTPNSHDGGGLASQQQQQQQQPFPPAASAVEATAAPGVGAGSRLGMPASPLRARSPGPAPISPLPTPSIPGSSPLGFGRQQQRNATHPPPPHLLIPGDPIQRSTSPSRLSPLTPSAVKRLSPLPSPNALAYYDIPPPSPPPMGPLPQPPTSSAPASTSASSLTPHTPASGLTSPPSSAYVNNHFPSAAALRQRLASTTSRGPAMYPHHDQNLSPMNQPPPSGPASRSTSPLPGQGQSIQRGRESPFPSRPVISPVPPLNGFQGQQRSRSSPGRPDPMDGERTPVDASHQQRPSEYRNWVQRVPQKSQPGQDRQYYVPAALQQPQNGVRGANGHRDMPPPNRYAMNPVIRPKKSVSFEDERPTEDDLDATGRRYGGEMEREDEDEDEVIVRGDDAKSRYSGDYDEDERNAYDGFTPTVQRQTTRRYPAYNDQSGMDQDERRGVVDRLGYEDDEGSAEGSAESWYSNSAEAAAAAKNAQRRMLGRQDESSLDIDNLPPPVPRLRPTLRHRGAGDERDDFPVTPVASAGLTSPLRRPPPNGPPPPIPVAPRESIPSEYAFEDDGRTLGDRTSRWSGSIYSRVSVMDADESGETRDRFVKRVEAMLREQEARAAAPPVPKLPEEFAAYSWQPTRTTPAAGKNASPGRSWNKF